MARAPNEKAIKAKELFDKGYKLIDIAKELNIPDGTIRRWKSTYKWDNEQSNNKSERSDKKASVRKEKKHNKVDNEKVVADEINELIENEELTDKQRLFCVIYSRCLNATKAYQKVYHCTYETAMVNGCNLLRNTKIKEQINKLNAIEFNKEFIRKSVLQKYIDIAFADITEYIKFGQRDEPIIDKDGNLVLDENGFIKTESYSYVELGESSQVDGTLINEIAQGKGGIKIKLADKMKALDVLNRYSNLLSDEEKVKLELENKKLANRKLSAELNKINGTDDTNVEDDGFIEALSGRAAEVWNNE
ncbi:terminase small subunit [Clostridium neonatale]|uniref:Phage terminase small subunit n=1 Tax=Clostridium neonatale TaxID=137838 RepID=A0AAD1YFB3_9CLOT|nr:terminase small subunit [Clostridium neonatale]CAI3194802.1 phage terminase small subunit [Clostridium neonatale]CAI3195955.1 phage terminase small subunit [Clostridium neonatale]CAI3202611.1 phage terminase small subunit [Clostridium neonatale]CAI3224513.1 phage terminase small subunit [Clostridium neonatale]CAI3225047.1 phage terminase small subunit [Clostridium neonatale]